MIFLVFFCCFPSSLGPVTAEWLLHQAQQHAATTGSKSNGSVQTV